MSARSRRERKRADARAAAERGAPAKRAGAKSAGPRHARRAVTLPAAALLGLVLLGAAILHAGALRLPFFADDYLFLESVRGRGFVDALLAPDPIGNFFRPVGRQLYFRAIGAASGESPLAFHAVNLALFLAVVTLVFTIVRRLAGTLAAVVASAFIALHYAADVPVRWVSGSQELLAVAGALGAVLLFLLGRRFAAAGVLLLALLAKESVAPAALIAMLAARARGEPWRVSLRRAWPLFAVTLLWAAVWAVMISRRAGLAGSLGLEPLGPLAVVVHLLHVAVGLEWRGTFAAMGRAVPPLLPLLPVAAALLLAPAGARGSRREVPMLALVWALAAAAPLVAVASIWSAYYYLFALCGVALGLGALAARWPRWAALAVVAALATGSQSGRSGTEFATGRGAWNMQSRINRFYVDRATGMIARLLADLKAARPTVPPRSTLYFGGVPAFLAWQTGNGPLVRWAYRDTSLRSHYQSDFDIAAARRGPVFFFSNYGDTLIEVAKEAPELRGIAMNVLMNDKLAAADHVLTLLLERAGPASDAQYMQAWVKWARGDTLGARGLLTAAGLTPARGEAPELGHAAARLAAGDTLNAQRILVSGIMRRALVPELHGAYSDLLLLRDRNDPQARIEALAAATLDPDHGHPWMRWGLLQAEDGRHTLAVTSLERALSLGGLGVERETQVRTIIRELRRAMPGGDLTQQALKSPSSGIPSTRRP